LIGINILIEGTSTGAATDIDGRYVINNVDPGVYTLIFSGVGYQRKIVTNVRVNSGFTTQIDAVLPVEAIGLETIVVEAVKPLVRKDLTSSHTVIDNTQIAALPVESIDQLLSLQAGLQKVPAVNCISAAAEQQRLRIMLTAFLQLIHLTLEELFKFHRTQLRSFR
jgi:hypothetical protein